MTVITLTPKEIITAATAGILRQAENIKNGRTESRGSTPGHGWQRQVEGALGEYAVAKFLGCFPYGFGVQRKSDEPDIQPGNIEVKTVYSGPDDNATGLRAWVYKNTPDDWVVILADGINGEYEMVGWYPAGEAKREEWWEEPTPGRPAFYIPRDEMVTEWER